VKFGRCSTEYAVSADGAKFSKAKKIICDSSNATTLLLAATLMFL